MTKAQLKYIQSLAITKNRREAQQFLVEGDKGVLEWIADGRYVEAVYATEAWLVMHQAALVSVLDKCVSVMAHEVEKMSTLNTATQVVLLSKMKDAVMPQWDSKKWYLALDAIRDPGNMGTIIRIADWYGIDTILASSDCVDIYNPKVVQASMGSLLRVNVYRDADLKSLIVNSALPLYITHLDGESVVSNLPESKGIIMMGNESKGVSEAYLPLATKKFLIPRLGAAESLNVAVATGIICHTLTTS